MPRSAFLGILSSTVTSPSLRAAFGALVLFTAACVVLAGSNLSAARSADPREGSAPSDAGLSAPESAAKPSYRRPSAKLFALDRERDTRTTTFGLEHGFPSLSVETVVYGPDGRLWIGSQGGLITFDGTVARTLPHKPSGAVKGTESLANSSPSLGAATDQSGSLLRVSTLEVDSQERVWVGTFDGLLRFYEGDTYVDVAASEMLGWVGQILETRDGSVWVSGMGVVRITDERPERIVPASADAELAYVSSLAQSDDPEDDSVWVSTLSGLARWTPDAGLEYQDEEPTVASFFDAAGRHWVIRDRAIEVGDLTLGLPEPLVSMNLRSVVDVEEGRTLVILNEESFLLSIDGSQIEMLPFRELGGANSALPGPSGSLWVTTPGSGLQLLEPKGFRRVALPEGVGNLVVCQPLGSQGIALGGWYSGGLYYLSEEEAKRHARATEIAWDAPDESPPTAPGIFDILCDTPTSGLLQCHWGLLSYGDAGSTVICDFKTMPQMTAAMARTASGAVWARSGMELIEVREGALTGRSVPLNKPFLTEIVADGETLYVVQSGGVEAIDTRDLSRREALSLPEAAYGGLFVEENGDLWAGTDGFGLYRKRASGEVDHWTVADGLPTDFMGWVGRAEGPTKDSLLWVNSNAGLLSIAVSSLDAVASGSAERLRFDMLDSGECYGPCGAAIGGSLLVLPTMEGPIVVDTSAPLPRRPPPVLSINAVRSRGDLVRPGHVLRGDTDLEFSYGAAEFPLRLSSTVEYRLEGYDEEWRVAGPDHSLRYTRLRPGRYQLQLRARSAGSDYGPILRGDWHEILPLWHQRTSVRLGAIASLLALGVGLAKLRTLKLVRHGAALEAEIERREVAERDLSQSRAREDFYRRQMARAEEAERSRMARDLHDDFSQRLAAVSLNLKLTTDAARSSLPANDHDRLLESQGDIDALAVDLHNLSRQLHPAVLDDLGLSAALRSECSRRARLSGIAVEFQEQLIGDEPSDEVRLALFRVAQEALQNAVKHADSTRILVRYELTREAVELTVQDDGQGFHPAEPNRSGLGLSSMHERMNLVGGTLLVEAAPSTGTRVHARVE